MPCAAVVTSNKLAISVPFPFPGKYQHTMELSGSGVLDGGTVSFNGPAPPASMPARTAVIAFP